MSQPSFTCPRCRRTSYHPLDVAARYCGHCHIFIDQWLCIRMRVAGDVVDEHWFDALEPGPVAEVATRHAGIRDRADAAGLGWQLEVYDPTGDRTVRVSSFLDPDRPPGVGARLMGPEIIDLDDDAAFLRRVTRVLGW
jgi:hypothetical protein